MIHGMVGLSSAESLGFLIAGLVLVGFFLGLRLVTRQGFGDRRPRPDIPAAMQPGPTDEDLEKPRLEKLQGWSLLSILFLALWIPVVWLTEPQTNKDQEAFLTEEAEFRGAKAVQLFSETNIYGVGCVRCHGTDLGGGRNLFNGAIVPVPSLQTVCGGPNTGHPLIHNAVDVRNTIMQGRPGTDMPSWSVRFAGGLDDQQIEDLIVYVTKLDQKYVPFKENVCINPNAKGYVVPVVPAQ
jgi:mono/diheme cytochrome c family protein